MTDRETIEVEVGDPTEIFAETSGVALLSLDVLGELPDDGREVLEAIRAYVIAHPKLETRFEIGALDLRITWRWRP